MRRRTYPPCAFLSRVYLRVEVIPRAPSSHCPVSPAVGGRFGDVKRAEGAQIPPTIENGGCGPQRRGGAHMKHSFPSRFYRERRDISTLSVLRKSAPSCTIGRGMRDGERMDSERTGW